MMESEQLGELSLLDHAHTSAGLSLYNEAAPGSGPDRQLRMRSVLQRALVGRDDRQRITPFGLMGKEQVLTYSVGEFLGEPKPGYKPLTNPPAFEEGEEPVGTQLTELNGPGTGNEWAPEGGLPSGWEASMSNSGERLEIQ